MVRTLRQLAALAVSVFVAVFLPTGALAATLYEYQPGPVWSGYMLGTAAGANQWGRFDVEFVPQTATSVDTFCFNVTTKENIASNLTFDLTVLFWTDDAPSMPFSTLFFDPFNWFDWLTGGSSGGSWYNLLAGEATSSFSETITTTDSSSTPNNDEVCFDIAADLEHSLGLPTGYPVIFRVEVPDADKNLCVRDSGDAGKCIIYYNNTAPYSSQSYGFSFENPPAADINRNAMFSGRITGQSNSPTYQSPALGGATVVDWTQSNPNLTPTSSSSGFDFSGATTWCGSAFSSDFGQSLCIGLGYLFIPSQDAVTVFMGTASLVKDRVPWSYLVQIQDAWDSATSSSQEFVEVALPFEAFGASGSLTLVSSASFTRWVSSGTLSTLRGFTTAFFWASFGWYLYRKSRYLIKSL